MSSGDPEACSTSGFTLIEMLAVMRERMRPMPKPCRPSAAESNLMRRLACLLWLPTISISWRAQLGAFLCLCWPAIAAATDALVPAHGPDSVANPIALQSRELLSATLSRPLFLPSRRAPSREQPRPIAVAEPPPSPPAPPSVILLGIVRTDQTTHALLRSGSAEKVIHARIGDDIGGWKVTEIEPRHVTLSLNERSSSVALFDTREPRLPYKPVDVGRPQRAPVARR
jgi:general secretion pathway protein N